MSVFERPKGSGRWVAKFQRRGEQVWVPNGPWPTKSAAREAERRHRNRLDARVTDETCASFVERWLEEWPRNAASTRRLYETAARRFAEHFGPTPIGEVERLSARTWALTVPRNVSRVIGTMYEDARNVGLVESNPFANLRLPATEKTPEIAPPTPDDYRALLEGCTVLGGYCGEMRAMITFAAWTGVRQGELFALQWDDVSEDEIIVRRSRKLDGSLGPPKNGQSRTIPLLPPARVLDQVPRREGSPFVFHSPQGKPLIKGTHGWSWQKVKAAARVEFRWHDLRHFCATQLLEMGLDHFAVSVQLGHTDGGALVMARYGHPSVDAAKGRLLAAFEFEPSEAGSATGSSR
ncbi:MAG: tyrosine-type recombinase/integrase [Solirubrobacterales bacterium]